MITARILDKAAGVGHGFFTRRGGVSEGPFASLNCGFWSGDDLSRVAANRARAMERLGLLGPDLVTAYQTHSAAVHVVETRPDDPPRADALVTRVRGVALGILTADCAPVLFADAGSGVIGAAHAGWRGARAGVLEATVRAMTELGARAGGIMAAIGPCIAPESYEVGAEFQAAFTGDDADDGDLFLPAEREGHYRFDLPRYVARRLSRLMPGALEALSFDTCTEVSRFFSYRRACLDGETDYGRCLSAIALER